MKINFTFLKFKVKIFIKIRNFNNFYKIMNFSSFYRLEKDLKNMLKTWFYNHAILRITKCTNIEFH